jgi:hypothetical protein
MAAAAGNIDTDTVIDTWTMNQVRTLLNNNDDVVN